MTIQEKFDYFKSLHVSGKPVLLYNAWNAGSAKAIVEGGAKVIATGSKPLALAQGYPDGEVIPFKTLLHTVRKIVGAVEVPISIDFEGGYSKEDNELLAENTAKLLSTGIVGVNFEDQKVGGSGLFPIDVQSARVAILRDVSNKTESPLFINSRTDLFLKEKDQSKHAALLDEAKARAKAYEQAGADGFFAPGLYLPELIKDLCNSTALPVNIIKSPSAPSIEVLAECGVARISYGPFAYLNLMGALTKSAAEVFGA